MKAAPKLLGFTAFLLSAVGCGASPPGVDAGEQAPDLRLPDASGTLHALSDYRGEVVLLEFWAMWCSSCQEEAPAVQALVEADEGFQALGVLIHDVDGNPPTLEDAADWAEAFGLTFPVLADEEQQSKAEWQPLQGLPATWVIDADGFVSWSQRFGSTPEELAEAIDAAR